MARPGTPAPHAWASLTADEAQQLLDALREWESERADAAPTEGWHTPVMDGDGNELTIEIE